jgi:hypothetical protein
MYYHKMAYMFLLPDVKHFFHLQSQNVILLMVLKYKQIKKLMSKKTTVMKQNFHKQQKDLTVAYLNYKGTGGFEPSLQPL